MSPYAISKTAICFLFKYDWIVHLLSYFKISVANSYLNETEVSVKILQKNFSENLSFYPLFIFIVGVTLVISDKSGN